MKAAFFCVDAQNDFMSPSGCLYVKESVRILSKILELTYCAMHNNVPVVASMDLHAVHDPEFETFPPHCINLTPGAELDPEACVRVPDSNPPRFIPDIIITKSTYDVFSNPLTEKILKIINAKQWFVYGVAADYCVRAAVLGMLKRRYKVNVIADAIAGVSADTTEKAYHEEKLAGAKFILTKDVEAMIK